MIKSEDSSTYDINYEMLNFKDRKVSVALIITPALYVPIFSLQLQRIKYSLCPRNLISQIPNFKFKKVFFEVIAITVDCSLFEYLFSMNHLMI